MENDVGNLIRSRSHNLQIIQDQRQFAQVSWVEPGLTLSRAFIIPCSIIGADYIATIGRLSSIERLPSEMGEGF